jgi:hypothetical protein
MIEVLNISFEKTQMTDKEMMNTLQNVTHVAKII